METKSIEILAGAVLKDCVEILENSAGQTTVSCRFCNAHHHNVKPPISRAITDLEHHADCAVLVAKSSLGVNDMESLSHYNLVKFALEKGCSIGVDFGDEDLEPSRCFHSIKSNIDCCDEVTLKIWSKTNQYEGFALIVNGLDDNELVVDYSDTKFFNDWHEQYIHIYG